MYCLGKVFTFEQKMGEKQQSKGEIIEKKQRILFKRKWMSTGFEIKNQTKRKYSQKKRESQTALKD